jgi:hypothetical protein
VAERMNTYLGAWLAPPWTAKEANTLALAQASGSGGRVTDPVGAWLAAAGRTGPMALMQHPLQSGALGHENRNLPRALVEFGLLAEAP